MLKNENIICISSIDWDFIWQGHQEIMAAFAKNANRVLFIENTGVRSPNFRDLPRIKSRIKNWFRGIKGIRRERENLYVFSPLVLPFPYSRLATWINKYLLIAGLKRWMKIVDFSDPIIWTFLPTPLSLEVIKSVNNKIVVYYCIAEFEHLVRDSKKIKKSEARLIKAADVIFAQGELLKQYCRKFNDNVTIFPFGISLEVFDEYLKNKGTAPADIKGLPRPVLGYIGGIHKHIDFGLIEFIADKNPTASVVLIGPDQAGADFLKRHKNIYFLGKKDHRQLASYINEFDVCLIPYIISEYTQTVYPTKLNEYLIMRKPVVSTRLPEMAEFSASHEGAIFVAQDYNDYQRCVERALSEDSSAIKAKREEIARNNSWQKRIGQMSEIMQKAIDIKLTARDKWWKENLLMIYRKTRRNTIKIAAAGIFIYLLIFKTPLIWFAAGPLKIAEPPRLSDAIAVVAGGVGESGKPGQGYEERVSYAVELYKKGYADKIIFSSGYTYAIQEADIMKALAVSLGVPAYHIILETQGGTAYQNIKYMGPLLKNNKIRSVLLVSSPYNMRRLLLLWHKNINDTNVICSPIPSSIFYGDGKIVKIQHIRAILHEYLGIIYYWIKGYI